MTDIAKGFPYGAPTASGFLVALELGSFCRQLGIVSAALSQKVPDRQELCGGSFDEPWNSSSPVVRKGITDSRLWSTFGTPRLGMCALTASDESPAVFCSDLLTAMMKMELRILPRRILLNSSIFLMLLCGCGTAVQRQGTEQLLLSDSVDRAIDQLDLSGLANRKVFLDTEYMKTFKGSNIYINSDYIISALRQKMTTSGLHVEVNRTDADYILEARVGALGTDSMEVTYGIPSSNGVGMAATAAGVPAVPVIPEMSFGKRNGMVGISKVVVYAYHRETGIPVWQSGSAVARSDARDSWMLGAGPLSQGSVYGGTLLAGNRINPPFEKKDAKNSRKPKPMTIADKQQYVHPAVLEHQLAEAKAGKSTLDGAVQQAGHEQTGAAGAVVPADSVATPGTPANATPVPAQPVLPPVSDVAPTATPAPSATPAPTAEGPAAAAVTPKAVPALPDQPPLVPPAP